MTTLWPCLFVLRALGVLQQRGHPGSRAMPAVLLRGVFAVSLAGAGCLRS